MKTLVIFTLAMAAVVLSAPENAVQRSGGKKKMVCYIGTWARYRPGDGKFLPEQADPKLCTHLMYGFAILKDNVISVHDPWGDLKDEWGGGHDGYKRFTALKQQNPELKTLIAIGGWNEGSKKYSEMSASPSSRKTFVDSVVPFLEKYGFDGLDLDWEYPTQRDSENLEDRENFSALVRELREAFNRAGKGYLLTAAVTPNTKTVEIAYEVPEISRDLDFINVMCYDYHGFWDGHDFTGHNTPLYRHPKDEDFEPFYNANDTVTYWLQAGLPKEKLIMGMALYGRGFTLARSEDHGLYAPTTGGIPQGPYTRQAGIWGYNEICEKFQEEPDQWKISINEHVKAPYAFNGRNWIGYEDVESIYYKAEYARNMDLGGAMVWSLETDDFKGKCHDEPYILLKTIVNTMNGDGIPEIPERPEVVPEDEQDTIIATTSPPADATTKKPRPSRPVRPSRRTTTPSPQEAPAAPPAGDSPTGVCTEEGIFPAGNCSGFYQCVRSGKGFQKHDQSCPAGTAFNPDISNCDHPSNVEGCSKIVRASDAYRRTGQGITTAV